MVKTVSQCPKCTQLGEIATFPQAGTLLDLCTFADLMMSFKDAGKSLWGVEYPPAFSGIHQHFCATVMKSGLSDEDCSLELLFEEFVEGWHDQAHGAAQKLRKIIDIKKSSLKNFSDLRAMWPNAADFDCFYETPIQHSRCHDDPMINPPITFNDDTMNEIDLDYSTYTRPGRNYDPASYSSHYLHNAQEPSVSSPGSV